EFTMEDLKTMLFYTGQKMDAWTLSLIPSPDLRKRSMVYAMNFKFPVLSDYRKTAIEPFDPLNDFRTLGTGVQADKALSEGHAHQTISTVDRLIQDYSQNPRPPRGQKREQDGISRNADGRSMDQALRAVQGRFGGRLALSTAFCMDLFGLSNLNCGKELDAIINLTANDVRYQTWPDSSTDVVLLNYSNYVELLENPKNIVPLLFAAKRVVLRFQSGATQNSSFFDDLKESFVQSGLSMKEAEELKWRVVGLVGTAGANLVARLRHYSNGYRGSRYALSLIAGGLPYLDQVSSQSGMNIYSFPKSVKATCNSGKSYHFMMAAYLSRTLARQGLNPQKSAGVVYQFAKAYNGPYRDLLKGAKNPVLVNSESAAGDIVRIDLSYNATGAMYGAFEQADASFDVDETLLYLYRQKNKGQLPTLMPDLDMFRGVKSYIETFNPNAAFDINLSRALGAK
ncbi:MAG: hypothetical protein KF789_09440, partial [Bdellovibrionaceae bacterium]|nr:hypothetical protein [Pseudobdellovibrionaceae bacterium]